MPTVHTSALIATGSIDGDAYLPPFDTLTVYFLKDLVAGLKKCKCIMADQAVVKNERVRHL